MTTRVLGIDPGLAGAYALLEGDALLHVADLPTFDLIKGKVKRAELDASLMADLLYGLMPINHAVIEQVASRPGQGISSTGRFLYACGVIYGVLVTLGLPVTFVLPSKWQKHMHVGPSPEAARKRVCELYPQQAILFSRVKDQHRADAVLIALAHQQP